ncbi:hypothetical protein PRIPAC_79773 [Pristionchus pacificus]|uniref:G protein-coupled receptor n=1 Tax=Pristionchus pacificus TaxID=54126 RepID=A0A2A6CK99_PRIPA|nr:hypothetical protein PRIPAC_79773 [Pristionchus pacificus]|eukprot:PDM78483.1 G protein-coupled receptor [Pristionchus pacificus]
MPIRDATNTTWVYNSQNGRDVYVNQPIYAASCAYLPAGISNYCNILPNMEVSRLGNLEFDDSATGHNCPCNVLPLEDSTKDQPGAMARAPSGYSGIFNQANNKQQYTCSPPCDFKMQCIGGLWIRTVQTGSGMDSFALSNGTGEGRPIRHCYRLYLLGMMLLRVSLVTLLLFVSSECSMKWDTKQDKNMIITQVEVLEVDRIVVGPQTNGICHWKGGWGCDPGNDCDSGYTYVGRTRQNAYNKWAGGAGGFCWFGTRYLCCENAKVHKNTRTSCKSGGGRTCDDGYEMTFYADWNGENLCCESGTIFFSKYSKEYPPRRSVGCIIIFRKQTIFMKSVVGFILNLLLLYLIRRFSSKELGSYKFLLEVFANIFNPASLTTGSAVLPLIMLRCPFRYSQHSLALSILDDSSVCVPHLIALFSKGKFITLLSLFAIIFQITWFIACWYLGEPEDTDEIRHYQALFRAEYGKDTNDGPLIMNYWREGKLSLRPFALLVFADGLEIMSFGLAATLAILTFREIRKAQNISEKGRTFQLRILLAASAQTLTPLIFVYITYFFDVTIPLFHGYSPAFSALSMVLLACFPCIDAVVVIVLMKPYRDGLLKILGKKVKESVKMIASAFTASTAHQNVYFSSTKKMCYLFEKAGNATCGAPFSRDVKMTTGCIAVWCFNATGVIDPANLQAENAPICPNTPIDGEATARVYVVSLMLPNGGSIVLDNNMQAFLTWCRPIGPNKHYVGLKSQNGRDVYKNLPIYAASCAYFPTGTTGTTCPCNPLPLEYSTRRASGATPPTAADSGACPSGYSGIFIQANTNQQYTCSSPCSDFKLQCIGGLWIHTFQSGNDANPGALRVHTPCSMSSPRSFIYIRPHILRSAWSCSFFPCIVAVVVIVLMIQYQDGTAKNAAVRRTAFTGTTATASAVSTKAIALIGLTSHIVRNNDAYVIGNSRKNIRCDVRFSTKELGTYRYLLEIFAAYDTYLVAIHHITNPKAIPSPSGFAYISDRDYGNFPLEAFYSSVYSVPFMLLNIHFLYRYWTIRAPHRIIQFSNCKFIALLVVSTVVGHLFMSYFRFYMSFVCARPEDDNEISHYRSLFQQEYGRDRDTDYFIMNYWRGSELSTRPFVLLVVADIMEVASFCLASTLAMLMKPYSDGLLKLLGRKEKQNMKIVGNSLIRIPTPGPRVFAPHSSSLADKMLPRVSTAARLFLFVGAISALPAKQLDGDSAVAGAGPNVSVSTLLSAVGTPYCMKPCIGTFAFTVKKVLTLNETTERLKDLCSEYSESKECLDNRKWCRLRNVFDATTSGIEHACITKRTEYNKVEACLKKNIDGILQKCDSSCNVRTELAKLSVAQPIKTAAAVNGNLVMVAKQVPPFCKAVRCGLPCVMKAANAACPNSGTLMIDSVLQPFDKAAALYAKATEVIKKMARDYLTDECLKFLDAKKLAEMRKGNF